MAVNRMGPPCPECGSLVTDVKRTTRSTQGHFWRRRDCPCCGHRFQTIQHTEIVIPTGSVEWSGHNVRIHWADFRSHLAKLLSTF